MRIPGWPVRSCRILAVLTVLTVLGGLVTTAPASAVASTCQGQRQPPSVHNATLSGVAVLSACNAWAVGSYSSSSGHLRTLIVHWNGTSWKRVPSTNPGEDNKLRSVAAASPGDIWAVGSDYVGGLPQTLIEHWNGTSWKTVASPDPGNPPNDMLFGVAVASSGSVWAVGDYYLGRADRTLILHWNGSTSPWTQVTSPNPAGYIPYLQLTSVAVVPKARARQAAAARAAGWYQEGTAARSLILHWNGTAWKRVGSPSAGPPATYT